MQELTLCVVLALRVEGGRLASKGVTQNTRGVGGEGGSDREALIYTAEEAVLVSYSLLSPAAAPATPPTVLLVRELCF
ncbi:hypothetical protein E2C01_092347 [Portunus trituberculatus]|uniref:Uncharacterized protein n=1 Tax=Portunus trituberculatus TaxID=210409 RepID=A0A5B7JVJ5_PORTR|nr:hypothetical protein [Portunus trituberculatus]